MPRHPNVAPATEAMTGSLFSKLTHRIAAISGERFALHVGDTYLDPAPGGQMEDLKTAEHSGLNRYASPHGHPTLLDALVRKHEVETERLLVTTGATGALDATCGALLAPGDEVLILAPYWPLIRGIVTARHGQAKEVPFYDRLAADPATAATQVDRLLLPYVSERSVALYVNTPNNPTGRVLAPPVQAAVADFARRHELWLWSDEVYAEYAWARPHSSVAEHAPERSFAIYSFSKAYGMAGNRCGYIIGPDDPRFMADVRKISTHSFYSAPTASQLAAAHVLEHGASWLTYASESYLAAGRSAARTLGLADPEGGTFLFIDVKDHLDSRGLRGLLEDCIDRGLVLAPGSSCGADYGTYVRLCFTCAPPDVVERGVNVLAEILAR
jgi:aspartate/methionine/tyrosine aminotransferase